VVSDLWMPRLREFKPEMMFISAGFDAHYEDEMGGLKLLEKDYAWVTEQMKKLAAEMCAEAHRLDARRWLRRCLAGAQRRRAPTCAGASRTSPSELPSSTPRAIRSWSLFPR
jgi:hypothetical protein